MGSAAAPACTTKSPFYSSLQGVLKYSHSKVKQGPTIQPPTSLHAVPPAKGEGELLSAVPRWGPGWSLSSHQGCLLAICNMFPAEILEHSHPRSPTVCTPELQCPRLTAVLGRKALGWELLGIPSAYSTSCSSDLQDAEDPQSRERSQNKAPGSSTVRGKLPDTSL